MKENKSETKDISGLMADHSFNLLRIENPNLIARIYFYERIVKVKLIHILNKTHARTHCTTFIYTTTPSCALAFSQLQENDLTKVIECLVTTYERRLLKVDCLIPGCKQILYERKNSKDKNIR